MSRAVLRVALVAAAGLLLGACSSVPALDPQERREYFSQAEYGTASPRVVALGRKVPRGGGRYQIGKPYKVAGRTFVPEVDPDYSMRGKASWYGAAFHGRKTANGEVYDMNALTAAHPTLPLPSYVRVTNLANGRSVVVRVNDRGPFAHGRIIDLSKAAALKLGYKGHGTAEVQVDYVGLARLDGRDERMLKASYSEPGKPARGYEAPLRRSIQVAAAEAPPRLRNVHEAGPALRKSVAAITPALIAPAPTAGGPDLLAPLILSGGFVTSFAPVERPDAGAAHQAAAGLGRQGLSKFR